MVASQGPWEDDALSHTVPAWKLGLGGVRCLVCCHTGAVTQVRRTRQAPDRGPPPPLPGLGPWDTGSACVLWVLSSALPWLLFIPANGIKLPGHLADVPSADSTVLLGHCWGWCLSFPSQVYKLSSACVRPGCTDPVCPGRPVRGGGWCVIRTRRGKVTWPSPAG